MPPKPQKSKGLQANIENIAFSGGLNNPPKPASSQDRQVAPATSTSSGPNPANDHAATSWTASATQTVSKVLTSNSSNTDPSAKENKNSVWIGLSAALQGLKISSSAIPPLSPLVSSLSECVGAISDKDRRRQEYRQLASDLTTELNSLGHHLMQSNSTRMSQAVQNLVKAIERQVEHIVSKQRRRSLARYADAAKDEEDLIECYRQIEVYFRQLQVDAMMSVWSNTNEQLAIMRLNYLTPAMQARYNSAQARVVRRRTCTPGTRTSIRKELHDWANNPDSPKVYWLNGMAGTGKTTIACSFSDELEKSCQLGASFFCSRLLPECRDMNRLVPTIAYQLASFSSAFRSTLCDILSGNHDLGSYDLDTQFNRLIRDPLLRIGGSVPANVVIVVDALDELSNNEDARIFLDTLFCHASDLPVRFLVTSRPEHGVRDRMLNRDDQSRTVLHLHDIEQSLVQADIELYLKGELHTISPSHNQVQQLTEQSGSLFIYAATAVRYIMPGSLYVDHHKRLEAMLQMSSDSSGKKHKDIDALYTVILTGALGNPDLEPEEADDIRLVLYAAVCVREPLNAKALATLLGLGHERRALSALQPLLSVLHVSESTGMVSTLHASFPDFMLNASRSGGFHCNESRTNGVLAARCFATMANMLRFNICDLESSYVFDEDVPGLDDRVSQAVPPELLYACLYWSSHLAGTSTSEALCGLLAQFLSIRLLFWMEVLSLEWCIGTGEAILYEGQRWLGYGASSDTVTLIKDARKFVTYFAAHPISRSTPHLYISALPFWSKESAVSMKYWKRTRGLVEIDRRVIGGSASALVVTWPAHAQIWSIAFSPSGNHVASGSNKGTIRVWDPQTGTAVPGPFKGHTEGVSAIVFSPDGTRIASGSWDSIICVWDVRTGALLSGPFEGHTDCVRSIAFSPDGAHIVSGSDDCTIRVWESHSGVLVAGPFEGHTELVQSVAYLEDGILIAAVSANGTTRVWDVRTGALVSSSPMRHNTHLGKVALSPNGALVVFGGCDGTIYVGDTRTGAMVSGPLEGRTGLTTCVAFSLDGNLVLAASLDGNMCVWDVKTGMLVSGPFEGHNYWAHAAAFSPDGTRIVSGSANGTIQVWDAQVGLLASDRSEGHTKSVSSVAFSADGTCIVSGSYDGTFCAWDAQSGLLRSGPFKGGDGSVEPMMISSDATRVARYSYPGSLSVCDAQTGAKLSGPFAIDIEGDTSSVFSPDGTRFASIYYGTICVWDAQNGSLISTSSEQHTSHISSIAFSPDGARIAAGSDDHTIRIWDADTGATLSGPFRGHTDSVYALAFSPDGTLVASGSEDATLRVWDAWTGTLVSGPFKGHAGRVSAIVFSPDGTRVVSGSADNTIRIWNARTGVLMFAPLEGHTDSVRSLAFSPDGTCIASGSEDTAIRIWSMEAANLSILEDWRMDSDGWVITNRDSRRLLWVPPTPRKGLCGPQNMAVVCTQGAFKLDFSSTLHGTQWHECYTGWQS